MVKDIEPRGERAWVLDKEFHPKSEAGKPYMQRWSFDGEIKLSLLLIKEPVLRRFEMARHIVNEFQADQMVMILRDDALIATKQGKLWVDVFWVGLSPDKLEEFCERSLLPLPPQYQEAWEELA